MVMTCLRKTIAAAYGSRICASLARGLLEGDAAAGPSACSSRSRR